MTNFKNIPTETFRISKIEFVFAKNVQNMGFVNRENTLIGGVSVNADWVSILGFQVGTLTSETTKTPQGLRYTRTLSLSFNYIDSDMSNNIKAFLLRPVVVRATLDDGRKVLLSSKKSPMRPPSVPTTFAANTVKHNIVLATDSVEPIIFWNF